MTQPNEETDRMTMTAEAPAAPTMPESVHQDAQNLIRSLAAVAGDEPAVYALLTDQVRGTDHESALGGLAAALVVMFTECITTAADPGEYVAVDLPSGLNEPGIWDEGASDE